MRIDLDLLKDDQSPITESIEGRKNKMALDKERLRCGTQRNLKSLVVAKVDFPRRRVFEIKNLEVGKKRETCCTHIKPTPEGKPVSEDFFTFGGSRGQIH